MIQEKSHKNILIYYIGSVTIKDSKYVTFNKVNPLYLIFNKLNGYFEEVNGNKYLTLVPTNESKEKIKKYEELWKELRSITKNLDNCDEKDMKINFNSGDELLLNKTVEIIVARAVFYE